MSSAIGGAVGGAIAAAFRRRGSSAKSERTWPRRVGYVFFFLFSFIACFYLTFPYDRVRDFVVAQVERALPGAELNLVSLEPAWITGVEARGVQLRLPPEPDTTPVAAGQPARRPIRPSVTLPYVYARVSILSYLLGTTEISFEAEVDGGGTIEGVLSDAGTESHVTAHLENVDMRRITLIRHYAGMSIGGTVTGDIDVNLADVAENTDGNVTLSIADATIGDEQFMVPIPGFGAGLQLSRVSLGTLQLTMPIENGTGRIQQLMSDGDDVVIRGTGTVRLLRPLGMTALDIIARAAIQPAYTTRNPAIDGALQIAASNPLVAAYRAPDGAFQVRLQGTLGSRVTALPAGSATVQ
jgi:type II secretion system protein N